MFVKFLNACIYSKNVPVHISVRAADAQIRRGNRAAVPTSSRICRCVGKPQRMVFLPVVHGDGGKTFKRDAFFEGQLDSIILFIVCNILQLST